MVVGRLRAAWTSGISSTDLRVGVPPSFLSTSYWVPREVAQIAKM